jgi:DNA/RNA endonuclease G (NUC1)/V8-like Glu-specific endopeptidase
MSPNPNAMPLYFNGVNGATGEYLVPPLSAHDVAALARGESIDSKHLLELKFKFRRATERTYAVVEGVDPTKLEEAGWGVIFPAEGGTPTGISAADLRDALQELLEHRRSQAARVNERFYQEFIGPRGYRPGETKQEFLARLGVGPGPADPNKGVPYYLLIVGDPQAIPFRVQYQLDVQYAVGRIWFDTLEEYRQYAHSVVAAETGQIALPRRVTFFGVQNSDDPATGLSARELVTPLAAAFPAKKSDDEPTWDVETVVGDGQATKARLAQLLGGGQTPALLFTASHGMGFPVGEGRQLRHQGALLCQDWPGPRAWRQAVPADFYFAADDVGSDARLAGLIGFHFACYGAGTPARNDFSQVAGLPDFSTPRPIVAPLPRKLLAHPQGGALAFVGHVDRAWGYSFQWANAGRQLQCFQSALDALKAGKPLGWAMENFNLRYAELSSDLSSELEDIKYGKQVVDEELAGMWTANNDARSYIVLGDPAVRLPLATGGAPPAQRPVIKLVTTAPRPDGPPMSAVSFSPEAAVATLDIPILETEKRYRERQGAREAVSFAPGVHPLLARNPPDRVRKRLRDLGLAPAQVESFLGGISFGIVNNAAETPTTTDMLLERIIGKNDLIGAEFLERGARAARATGRIRIRAANQRVLGFGTGSLIAPRLLLTNNHVLGTLERAAASTVEFNVEDGLDGKPLTPVVFALAPQEFFLTDPALDFTVVALGLPTEGTASVESFGFNFARPEDNLVLVEEYVNIVQHPNGQPKQLALRDNQVVDLLPDFLHYRADTQPGSSGSPVFNDQWQLVGLHHSGVPKRDGQGRILARGGGIWSAEMGENQIDWIANEGVRLNRILQRIKEQAVTDGGQRRLRDTLFDPTPASPRPSRPVSVAGKVPDSSPPESAQEPGVSAPVAARPVPAPPTDGTLTFSVPLQISVRLAMPVAAVGLPTTPAGIQTESPTEFAEAVSIDPNYEDREGYDEEFLGEGTLRVPLPRLSAAQQKDAVRLEDEDSSFELKYHHYSVVMNGKRGLAYFTAVNIDGRSTRKIKRDTDKWMFDPRIDAELQLGNLLYKGSEFDRGHLVRRLDPAWGRTQRVAKVANDDTFHFTNCSPQHKRFNEGKNLWAGLEDYLLDKAGGERKRMIVFTGPVFARDDPRFRDVQIPRQFWKVAVVVRPNSKLATLGFVVSQADLIEPVVEEAAIDVARTFQVPIRKIEELTGLDFGRLHSLEAGSVDTFGLEAVESLPLESVEDIVLPTSPPAGDGQLSFSVAPASAAEVSATAEPPEGYYLVAFDKDSNERTDGPGGPVSERVLAALAAPVTDVVLFSHGWQNDVPDARRAYGRWLDSMRSQSEDLVQMRKVRPAFRPLLVGIHWPSQPWGDERLDDAASFGPAANNPVDRLVQSFATRLGDGDTVRERLRAVVDQIATGTPSQLPSALGQAYRSLDQALGLQNLGAGAPPGLDREDFNPEAIFEEVKQESEAQAAFSPLNRDALLAPLRTLSFWKMKDRGRQIGEKCVHPLLVRLQGATQGRDVRFHLIGHSFGCIVVSAAVVGPPGGPGLPRPVDSLVLLQGALSLWAYCKNIAFAGNRPGYFARLFADQWVRGPVVTTQSRYDIAVGGWYPRGARVARQVSFALDQLPKYGGIGSFGIQGPGLAIADDFMLAADLAYDFVGGRVYNLESSAYIRQNLGWFSGAHSDLCHPEVAHAVWSTWRSNR